MMRFLVCLFLLLTNVFYSFSQKLESGYYTGEKLPFTKCFLKYSGNTSEVDFFYLKAGIFFDHDGPKNLFPANSKNKKLLLSSTDDSIKVFRKKRVLVIKRKGSGNIKLEKAAVSEDEIKANRNKVLIRRFRVNLYDKVRNSPGFEVNAFREKLNSYKIENSATLSPEELKKRLLEIEREFLSNL